MASTRRAAAISIFIVLTFCCTHGAAAPVPQWDRVAGETLEHFRALLRMDTSNPPGNESSATAYLKTVLEKEGVPVETFAREPDRANLVARLKGNGSKKPVLVMGHTDVVGVQRANWTYDPFAAIRKDGWIFGRGAQDDKDHVAAGLMLMLLLKRLNVPLDRDVIFLAEAGEEGTTKIGIDFMVNQHWPEIEAEFALAEGGATVARNGRVRYVGITTTEKVPRGMRLVAHGTAAHGSRPTPDNAVIHLAAAVARFGAWQPPMRLNETTRIYFQRLAAISLPAEAARYRAVLHPAHATAADHYFKLHEFGHYSILRTSITPTILRAGFRHNVIPSEAEAVLDVRALPDENMAWLVAQIGNVIGDPEVEVVPPNPGGRPASPPSRLDTEMFRALEHTQQRMFPGAVTLPTMLTGATDMAQLRARGVQAYGYGPIVDEDAGPAGGAHGDDERIAVASLNKLVEFLWDAVVEVAAAR